MKKQTGLVDIEGTLIQIGNFSPKYLGIIALEKKMKEDIPNWDSIRQELMADFDNYKRFFVSPEDFLGNDHDERLVVYEGIKKHYSKQAKELGSIMADGIKTGELSVVPYEDVEFFIQLFEIGYEIGTFSGAPINVQHQILSRIPIGKRNLFNIVNESSGMQTAKEIGKKTQWQTYKRLAEIYGEQGRPFEWYVTDAAAECFACKEAGIDSIFVNRREKPDPKTKEMMDNGIGVVNSLYDLDYGPIEDFDEP